MSLTTTTLPSNITLMVMPDHNNTDVLIMSPAATSWCQNVFMVRRAVGFVAKTRRIDTKTAADTEKLSGGECL